MSDDPSGRNVAGSFVRAETPWNHFQHFRRAFESHGLSHFSPSSSTDQGHPKSQFQRALRGLGVAHLPR